MSGWVMEVIDISLVWQLSMSRKQTPRYVAWQRGLDILLLHQSEALSVIIVREGVTEQQHRPSTCETHPQDECHIWLEYQFRSSNGLICKIPEADPLLSHVNSNYITGR
jgi:hypothetical protein